MARTYHETVTTPAAAAASQRGRPPFVSLLSDFSLRDPSAGIMRAVVAGICPEATVVDMAWVDNGPGWIGVLLPDRDTVLSLEPDVARSTSDHQMEIGVVAPIRDDSDDGEDDVDGLGFEVRAFFTGLGGRLPVTGSSAATPPASSNRRSPARWRRSPTPPASSTPRTLWKTAPWPKATSRPSNRRPMRPKRTRRTPPPHRRNNSHRRVKANHLRSPLMG